nr:hypothetical protein [Paenibacillus larvae]
MERIDTALKTGVASVGGLTSFFVWGLADVITSVTVMVTSWITQPA